MMKIGFIGAGNMGGTLAGAAARALGGECVMLADPDSAKVTALASALGAAVADNATVVTACDYVFLGVKPQVLEQVLIPLQKVLAARTVSPVIVSMAAGVSTAALTGMLGGAYPLIRIMPNTPAAVGEGMILYTAANGVSPAQIDGFLAAMAKAGRLCAMEERLIDAASAVSGCGPAFVYMFIEALADGGVECGLPRATAQELAAQTVLGSAAMVLQSGTQPGALKDAVCSPGGTMIAGVHALEAGAFRAAAMDAVTAAYERTLELKK